MSEKKTVWDKNFATNASVRDRVREHYVNKTSQLRNDRVNLEESWMKFWKMWNVAKDGYAGYNGRAQLYIPEVRKSVEAQARKMTDAAFPTEDVIDCSPGEWGTPQGAEIQRSVRLWQIEQSQLRLKYHVFARQQCMLGTSPVYVPWRLETTRAFMNAKDKKTGRIKPQIKELELFKGPDFVVKDLFKWYLLNPKERDVQKSGCFEYGVLTESDLVRKQKNGELYGLQEILKGPSNAHLAMELQRDVERAETLGLQIQNQGYAGEAVIRKDGEGHVGATYKVCTIYDKMVFPEACEEGEDKELPIPVQIEIYNDEVVGLVRRNPFFHQRVPYVVGHYIQPNADEGYGQGIPWAVQYLQYELNSTFEQTMDSKTLALNPIALVDPGLAGQTNDFVSEPGAVWFVNPLGVKFGSVPDLTQTGYQAMNQTRAMMQDYSDRNPAVPSELTGKARSATQADQVTQSMSIDDHAFQMQNEILVLNPCMEMWESLTDQNIDEDQVIMMLGKRATDWRRVLVTKNQTLGRYRYFWKAASDQKNKQVTARQIIDMMKVVGSLPPGSVKNFDFNECIKVLWKDLYRLPDADKIIGSPEEMQSQDPEVEHKMLALGMELQVLPGDDDGEHLQAHDGELKKLKKSKNEPDAKELLLHMFKHRAQLQAKVKMAQQQQAMVKQQMMMQAQAQAQDQGGAPGAPPTPDGGGLQGSGNRTQLSPNASIGNQGSGIRG